MTGFWQLPSPATFLQRVSEDIREGNNIVVAIPHHAPEGLAEALRLSLALPSLPRLEEIQANGAPPISALHQELSLGPCSAHTSVVDLCASGGFQSRLIHVQHFTSTSWTSWSGFLNEYEDVCRHYELAQRTLFIATLQGELAAQAPPPANLLRVHQWLETVDTLNARLYAANLLSGAPLPPWQRQLAAALLSELALWDPEVIVLGASLPLADILSPATWLAPIATARGWSPADDLKSPLAQWRGLRQPFEGQLRTHSAWLALAGREDALAQRVWAGQVSAVFPLLERHRRAILSRYRALLRVPWTSRSGITISQLEDLELNHLADQLCAHASGGLRSLYQFVCWLRDLRNDLAHLTPVPTQRLLDTRFEARMGHIETTDDD